MILDFSPMAKVTMWKALIAWEPPLQSRKLASTSNTEPNEERVYIPKELYGDWNSCPTDPFPDFEGVVNYAKSAGVWDALQKNIEKEDYASVITTPATPLVSEIAVEISLKSQFDIVNLALKKTCPPGSTIVLASGKAAMKDIDVDARAHMEPDRASFYHAYSVETEEWCFCICDYDNNTKNVNLIPGEVKVSYKFKMSFLTGTKRDFDSGVAIPDLTRSLEAEKVFTQVYQYMNQLGAHYGYLITDRELICIRRCDETVYGAMDLSASIPLSTAEGNLNAKLALWYLHHRYVIHDPSETRMPRTPTTATWEDDVRKIYDKRKEREDEEFKQASKRAHYEKNTKQKNRSRTNLRSDAQFGNSF